MDAEIRAGLRYLKTLPVEERLRVLLEFDPTAVDNFLSWYANKLDLPLGNVDVQFTFVGQKGQIRPREMRYVSSNGMTGSRSYDANGLSWDRWNLNEPRGYHDSPPDDTGRDMV